MDRNVRNVDCGPQNSTRKLMRWTTVESANRSTSCGLSLQNRPMRRKFWWFLSSICATRKAQFAVVDSRMGRSCFSTNLWCLAEFNSIISPVHWLWAGTPLYALLHTVTLFLVVFTLLGVIRTERSMVRDGAVYSFIQHNAVLRYWLILILARLGIIERCQWPKYKFVLLSWRYFSFRTSSSEREKCRIRDQRKNTLYAGPYMMKDKKMTANFWETCDFRYIRKTIFFTLKKNQDTCLVLIGYSVRSVSPILTADFRDNRDFRYLQKTISQTSDTESNT